MAETADTAQSDAPEAASGGAQSQPGAALTPAQIELLAHKVYRLASAEARLSAARGERRFGATRTRT